MLCIPGQRPQCDGRSSPLTSARKHVVRPSGLENGFENTILLLHTSLSTCLFAFVKFYFVWHGQGAGADVTLRSGALEAFDDGPAAGIPQGPGRCSRSATTSSSATRCRTWRFSLDVVEDLVETRYSRDRRAILARANLRLEKLRVLLRLCHALGYFPHARSAVESLVMTLQDLTPREPQAQLFFRIVDEQADNMRALIGDLLDTARIEAGALSVAAEAADVAALAERTV